jgi:hypothetical protein
MLILRIFFSVAIDVIACRPSNMWPENKTMLAAMESEQANGKGPTSTNMLKENGDSIG